MNIKDKVIMITGSADRVGKTIAIQLAGLGAQVIIHYHRNKDKAIETANFIKKFGNKVIVVNGDISREDDWLKIKNEIMQEFGRIDTLINNAAIFYKTPFLKSDPKDWDNFMNINLKGVYLGCKIMGESMFEQKSGIIINISDVSAVKIWSSYIPYCVSKAGVIALTKGIAKALAPYVLVNCVAPGTVLLAEKYDEIEEQNLIDLTPLKRVGSPEDIANTVQFLIEGGNFITGAVIKVDGGRSLN